MTINSRFDGRIKEVELSLKPIAPSRARLGAIGARRFADLDVSIQTAVRTRDVPSDVPSTSKTPHERVTGGSIALDTRQRCKDL